jgi:IS1 family transposase
LDNLRVEPEKAYQIIRMLCEGVGVRACERLAGVNRRTVLNVLATAGHKAIDLMESRVKNIEAKFVSVDEMFGFVGCLQQNTTVDDRLRGDQYVFTGIEQTTKLIICWCVGKRDKENAQDIMRELKAKTTGRFQLTTDNYNAYSGWSGAVRKTFGGQIDYGVETKKFATEFHSYDRKVPRRFNPVKCIAVIRKPIIGKPKRWMMTTNHSERFNLSFRLFNRRFTRKTIGYSKTLRNHKLAVALQVAYFNFCRPHSALKIKATETTPAIEQTPAMAQGITNRIWTVNELLGGFY